MGVLSKWLTKKDLSLIFNCSNSTIRRWTEKLGVSSKEYYDRDEILDKLQVFANKRKTVEKKPKNKVMGLFSKQDLEKLFGKADTTIVRWIKAAELPTSQKFYSIEEVEKIKLVSVLYSLGYTTKEIINGLNPQKNLKHIHSIDIDAVTMTVDNH